LDLFHRHLNYRYAILCDRYLNLSPPLAYQRLMRRLISASLVQQKLRTWVEQSHDRQQFLMTALQEVVHGMLEHNAYLQEQCIWVQHCTDSPHLRHLFVFASLEEYALRPIRNQPLISLRILTHLIREQRGGITQVPAHELVQLVPEHAVLSTDEPEYQNYEYHNRFDTPAIEQHEDPLAEQDRNYCRHKVQREFELYLNQELGEIAVTWLRLYLQGHSQEKTAELLGIPIKQLYRLREKISYHAIKAFSVRVKPELVAEWLNTSLQEHNLGLTPSQWEHFWQTLTPQQHLILGALKKGLSLETIAAQYHLKRSQVNAEWGRLYLAAQRLRNQEEEMEQVHY
jgi:DNA-binding CsgD family transcriptional regulator/DNA-directed RNA polymerase specialized sigma24 family protein